MRVEIGTTPGPGRLVELPEGRPLVIGRGRGSEISLADQALSRRHCQLVSDGRTLQVVDLGSANGTFVNGRRLDKSAVLRPGDEVRIGDNTWIRALADPQADTAPPQRVGAAAGAPVIVRPGVATTPVVAAAPGAGRGAAGAPAAAPAAGDGEGEEILPKVPGYQILEAIGQGSFGKVYRAKHLFLQREAAIKVIPTGPSGNVETIARFVREIEAAGKLRHPNLVRVYGAGEGEGFAFLAMEFVRGETLAKRIIARGRLVAVESLTVARQVASALEHAFERGFVHRDVKPENILLDYKGDAKLCDFGLVKSLGASSVENLTRPGQGFGSLSYMPPEQVRDAYKADQRADVYSIGATLYHMATGKRPFSGTLSRGLLRKILEEMPEPMGSIVPDMPREVVRIVERCLRKAPTDRFATPGELRRAIEEALAALGAIVLPIPSLAASYPGVALADVAGAASSGGAPVAAGSSGAATRSSPGLGDPRPTPGTAARGAPLPEETQAVREPIPGTPAFRQVATKPEKPYRPSGPQPAGFPGEASAAGANTLPPAAPTPVAAPWPATWPERAPGTPPGAPPPPPAPVAPAPLPVAPAPVPVPVSPVEPTPVEGARVAVSRVESTPVDGARAAGEGGEMEPPTAEPRVVLPRPLAPVAPASPAAAAPAQARPLDDFELEDSGLGIGPAPGPAGQISQSMLDDDTRPSKAIKISELAAAGGAREPQAESTEPYTAGEHPLPRPGIFRRFVRAVFSVFR